MIEKESLAINPIVVSRKADTPKASAQKHGAEGKEKGGSGCRKRG